MTPREERISIAIAFAAMVLVGFVVCMFATGVERGNCLERWEGSTVSARYHWRHGCQVLSDRHGWVPESNFNARYR